jgi:hypothetical protein
MARDFGLDREAEIRRGDVRDPRAGRMLLKDWIAEWLENRVAEPRGKHKAHEEHRSIDRHAHLWQGAL